MNNKRTMVELSKIKPDPKNPRQSFDPKTLSELEASIRANGILNPLVVEEIEKGEYLLVDGERRYRSAKKLGLKEVPVTIMDSMTDAERLVKRFHLQEQHQNWSHYEKSLALVELQKSSDMIESELASTLGISLSTVNRYILISTVSKRVATEVSNRKLPFGWIVGIAGLLKLADDGGLREDLEEALFDKIDRKVIVKNRELVKYKVAIKSGGDKIVNKIISDPKYSPTKASMDTNTDNVVDIDDLLKAISTASGYAVKLLMKHPKVIPARAHNRIAHFKKLVDELMDIDYEDDGKGRNK
jgi:ParB/RepB/Spo0J family partition protein